MTNTDTNFFNNRPARERFLQGTVSNTFKRTYQYAFGRLDASPTDNYVLAEHIHGIRLKTRKYSFRNDFSRAICNYRSVCRFDSTMRNVTNRSIVLTVAMRIGFSEPSGGRQNSTNVTAQSNLYSDSNMVVSGRFSRGFLNEKLGSYLTRILRVRMSSWRQRGNRSLSEWSS